MTPFDLAGLAALHFAVIDFEGERAFHHRAHTADHGLGVGRRGFESVDQLHDDVGGIGHFGRFKCIEQIGLHAGRAFDRDAHAGDGEVAIVVEDHGPGVPRASRARLFELFYRDPSSARSVAGSGIGLFVCASLVEAMGGRIWVDDTPGGGARFGFTLRPAEEEGDGFLLQRANRGERAGASVPSSEVVLAGTDGPPPVVGVEPGA